MALLVSNLSRIVENQEIPGLLDKLLKKAEDGRGWTGLDLRWLQQTCLKAFVVFSSLEEAERATQKCLCRWFEEELQRVLQEPTEFPFREKGPLFHSWTGAGEELRRRFQQIKREGQGAEVTVENVMEKIEEVRKEAEEVKMKIGAEYTKWGEEIARVRTKMNEYGRGPSNPTEYDRCWSALAEARAELQKLSYEKVKSSLARAEEELLALERQVGDHRRLQEQKMLKKELLQAEYSSCPVCGQRLRADSVHTCPDSENKKLTSWAGGEEEVALKASRLAGKVVAEMRAKKDGWHWYIRVEEVDVPHVDEFVVETTTYYEEPEEPKQPETEKCETEEADDKEEVSRHHTVEDLLAKFNRRGPSG